MMDTNEREELRAMNIEVARLDFISTGNPVSAWRALAFATCGLGEEREGPQWGTGPVLAGKEIQDAFARLPPEILSYLSQCASRVMALSFGIDWRAPPAEDDNGVVPSMHYHVMGLTAAPPLSPPEAASLLPQALDMVSVGSNAFSKDRSAWVAEVAALIGDQPGDLSKRERLEIIIESFGLAEERSAQRLVSKGRELLARRRAAYTTAKQRRAAPDKTKG